MPRPSQPARLWLREIRGRKFWYILAGGRQIGTGCGEADRATAEARLAEHIGGRHKPSRDSGRDPAQILIADVLNIYLTDRGQTVARPDWLARRVENLLSFFGEKPVASINRRLCQDYVAQRGYEPAARRELEDLSAALGHAFDEEILPSDVRGRVKLPPKSAPRERWLTRDEAAKLIRAAWRFRQRERDGELGDRHTRRHIARFILVGLYTGTRATAICQAAMMPAVGRGYVDLDQGVFFRREPGTHETNKRRPPVRLPQRLLAHMRRWRRRGISAHSVIEFNGQQIECLNRSFKRAVQDAGLSGRVTPHTLRHTAISWAMQGGAPIWDVSAFFGVSPMLITKVYGHFHPDAGAGVAKALMRKV